MLSVNHQLEQLSRPSTSDFLSLLLEDKSGMRQCGDRGEKASFQGNDKGIGGMSCRLRGADDSSPDLIVHGVLGMERSMDQIREEMRGIMERLVRIHSLLLSFHLFPRS